MSLSAIALGVHQYWRYLNPDRPTVEDLAAVIEAPNWDSSAGISTPTLTPTVAPAPIASAVPAVRGRVPGWPRIRIASIDVDAPISNKSMIGNVMQNPNGPEDVAWYDFSSRPGGGSNVVMAGHVDFRDYGPAVFAKLKFLGPGDVIEVALQNGTLYTYEVTSVRSYNVNTAPTADLISPVKREILTIITCDGAWDGRANQYVNRLVVRAERVNS